MRPDGQPTLLPPGGEHLAAASAGALLLATGGTLHLIGLDAPAGWAFIAAWTVTAWPVGRAALRSIRRGRPFAEAVLMGIAGGAAAILGEWWEAGLLLVLFEAGQALEVLAQHRAREAVRRALDLAPPVAHRLDDSGCEQDVPVELLHPGDRVRVRPGERAPGDGTILTGEALVDASAATGEARPVRLAPGSPVAAGSIPGDGSLTVELERTGEDSTTGRALRAIKDAERNRSGAERWIDRFTRWYTPVVLAVGALLFLTPTLLGGDPRTWALRALGALVVACPCALVISTPVTVLASLATAGRRGVLVKGGAPLEAAARVRTVAFDKTGTVTLGRPAVESVETSDGFDAQRLLRLAAAVEVHSEHPIARAIVREARERGLAALPASEFRAIPGHGASARVEGMLVEVGSPDWIPTGSGRAVNHDSVAAVRVDGAAAGWIALRDGLRPEAAEALAGLQRLGVRGVLLTGDLPGPAEEAAGQLGIEVRYRLSPEAKRMVVEEFRRRGGVAMVGDGINDAQALAGADLGIAMGAAGKDVAMQAAGVVVFGEDLRNVPWLISHSRAARGVLWQNVAFALLIKAAALGLVGSGVWPLWTAVLADNGAMILVVLNALRLLRGAG
jgi:Cd2+/Zn2+-exporting ATPase